MIDPAVLLLAIEGGAGLLTALLAFSIVVVSVTFVVILWVTYTEWQRGTLW